VEAGSGGSRQCDYWCSEELGREWVRRWVEWWGVGERWNRGVGWKCVVEVGDGYVG
jgi:hypothetical protein